MSVMSTLETLASADTNAERMELERVLTSRSFAKSPRLCSLLRFIVTESLEGRPDNLAEQQIGIQIFGRTPGYNSSQDTIVRATVRQLRQRLDLYYSSEGTSNELRIDIPKGGYVANVTRTRDAVVEEFPRPSLALPETIRPLPSPTVVSGRLSVYRIAVIALAVVVLALSVICVQQWRKLKAVPAPSGPVALWRALFTPGRKTLIVPGDAALDMYSIWEQRPVPLEQYATQSYQGQPLASIPPTHTDVPLGIRSVTPMADLALVAALVKAPEHMGVPSEEDNVEIRYARDVAVADTHDNNLILIGSDTFNPWVTLYQQQMDFVAHYDLKQDVYTIDNKAVRPGEQSQYVYRRTKPSMKATTHVALLSNSQGAGRVLIVEGTSMGSTYGALSFLRNESLYAPVLRQATDTTGRLHDFEVLLSGELLHGGVGNTKVLALHVH